MEAWTVHKPLCAMEAKKIACQGLAERIEIQKNRIFGCIKTAAESGDYSTVIQEKVHLKNIEVLNGLGYTAEDYGEGWTKVSW